MFNNKEERRYSLRKLTVGLASVCIGLAFLHGGKTIKADTVNDNNTDGHVETDSLSPAAQKAEAAAKQAKNSKPATVIEHLQGGSNAAVKTDAVKAQNSKAITNKAADTQTSKTATVTMHIGKQTSAKVASVNNAASISNADAVKTTNNVKTVANTAKFTEKAVPMTPAERAASIKRLSAHEVAPVDYTKAHYTEQQMRHAFDLDKADLTDAQLSKLGLNRSTYRMNGTNYEVTGRFTADLLNGQHFDLPFNVTHNADGSFHDLYFDENYNLHAPEMGVTVYGFNYSSAPIIKGGTITVDQDHQLSADDARAALPDKYADGYQNLAWANSVNTSAAGSYQGTINVTWKNKLTEAVPAIVIVKALGKTRMALNAAAPAETETAMLLAMDDAPAAIKNQADTSNEKADTNAVSANKQDDNETATKAVNANQNQKENQDTISNKKANAQTSNNQKASQGNTVTIGKGTTTNKPKPKPTYYTEAQMRHAFDLDKADLTDAQLAALGVDKDTYIMNGIKYKVTGDFTAELDNGQKFDLPFHVTHNADGSFHNLYFDDDYNLNNVIMRVHTIGFNYKTAPYIEGSTIYIHQGHQLVGSDALPALPSKYAGGYQDVKWNLASDVSNVNVNVPSATSTVTKGQPYHAAVEITYKNQLGVSTGINVVVIGPDGKDSYTTRIHHVPDASVIINNDKDIQQHFKGATYSWEKTPDVSAPTDGEDATVIVTWPDKTTTKVPTKIIVKDTTSPATDTETVTRDIYEQLEGQQPTKIDTQKVTLTRTGTKDDYTGHVTWGNWQAGNMPSYAAPDVANYTCTNPDNGTSVSLDGSQTQLSNVVFDYTAKHETITSGEGTTEDVTRDIYTKLGDNAATLHDTQTITLHRTGDKNMATGDITWGAWTPAQMPEYEAPSETNWTVTNPDAGAAVTAYGSMTKLPDVVFDYTANTKQVEGSQDVTRDIYTKIDDKPVELHDTQTVTLHRTGTKDLTTGKIVWDGWITQQIPSYNAPDIGNYTCTNPDAGKAVKADGTQDKLADVVFDYTAKHETITSGEGTSKVVTRGIYTKFDGQDAQLYDTQTVILHRTGDENLATGAVSWNAWTPGTIPTYDAPSFNNRTCTDPSIGVAVTVDGTNSNAPDVVFVYKDNTEEVKYGAGTTMDVSRNIYTQIDGQPKHFYTTQTTVLHRTGTRDLATGKIVSWNDWQAGTTSDIKAPVIDDYTVTNPDAGKGMKIDGSTATLPDIVFVYKEKPQENTDSGNTDNTDDNTDSQSGSTPVNDNNSGNDSLTITGNVPKFDNTKGTVTSKNKPKTIEKHNTHQVDGTLASGAKHHKQQMGRSGSSNEPDNNRKHLSGAGRNLTEAYKAVIAKKNSNSSAKASASAVSKRASSKVQTKAKSLISNKPAAMQRGEQKTLPQTGAKDMRNGLVLLGLSLLGLAGLSFDSTRKRRDKKEGKASSR